MLTWRTTVFLAHLDKHVAFLQICDTVEDSLVIYPSSLLKLYLIRTGLTKILDTDRENGS